MPIFDPLRWLLLYAILVLGCALPASGPPRSADSYSCLEGGSFDRAETFYLDVLGNQTQQRVDVSVATNDRSPPLARIHVGQGKLILAAPDRLIFGVGTPPPNWLSQFLTDTAVTSESAALNLGGGAILVTLSSLSDLPESLDLNESERSAAQHAPGLALVAALRRKLAAANGPETALSVSFDRLILRGRPRTTPGSKDARACLEPLGAWGLRALEPAPGWWIKPAPVVLVDSGVAEHWELGNVQRRYAIDASHVGEVVDWGSRSPGSCLACDQSGHGTNVAGAIGSATYGVAPKAPIIPVRVFDEKGCGWASSVVAGLHHLPQEARIVVIPWTFSAPDRPVCGGSNGRTPWADEICFTIQTAKDRLFLVAAGNEPKDLASEPLYPASWSQELDNLLVVGGVASEDRWNSTWGAEEVHLAALAASCKTTTLTTLDFREGTSMAVGFVAGAAALYWAKNPTCTLKEVKNALVESARYHGSGNYSACCRDCGVLDVSNTLGLGVTALHCSKPKCPL